jgi:broad specificity phosphatase PhoE
VAEACEEIAARHGGERVAIFAHAGTIDAALRWALGIAPGKPWQHEFDLSNASISEVVFWPRGRVRGGAPRYAFLKRIADRAHLGGLSSEL